MKLQSDFAILDVKRGRVGLSNALEKGKTVLVTIEAEITKEWGGDDGTSIEFELKVNKVTVDGVMSDATRT